ncbi:hypothetical protein NBT05_03070 [Aquimarina sp. ERC-38]|uniref:O-antigen ligase family protein n=1 Tax=Aquimarina sp. ERC-38 TaxID=2949996 RepID=UPI002246006A|nr:O-antigen ligase family protein [Aquimarina sp. ERC-38]UZO81462.1 hypothetical protein NBT05_03070 [Aquimarina sp. ERC-38]
MNISLKNRRMVTSFTAIYLLLVIVNSIKEYTLTLLMGRYGKLVFAMITIPILIHMASRYKQRFRFKNKITGIVVLSLVIIFSIYYVLSTGDTERLLYNLALPVYLLFYFFLSKNVLFVTYKLVKDALYGHSKIWLLTIFQKVLFFNLFFWFAIAFATGMNMADEDGFGGFFQDKVHFGLYTATGFLVCFYLRYNKVKRDRSIYNLLQLAIYVMLAFVTSRNALLIIFTAVFSYVVITKAQKTVSILLLLLFPLSLFYLDTFFYNVSGDQINSFSTGRWEIWRIAWVEIVDKGVFFGSGIFNINNTVLYNNLGTGFHYLDTLEFLFLHSSYLEILAGGGMITLILFLVIVVSSWNLFSNMDKAVMIAILFGGIGESYLAQPFMLISTLFYLILIINNHQLVVRNMMRKKQLLPKEPKLEVYA